MSRKFIASLLLVAASAGIAAAQSIWSRSHLDEVKSQLDRPMYNAAYTTLINHADKLLDTKPVSVIMKAGTPASGDKHDYTSLARYYHPDPTKPDGLPYVSRDGVTNP